MAKLKQRPKCTVRCKHCGTVQKTDMMNYEVGFELIPYAGGGDYGYCYKCQKPGLIVIEIPTYPATVPVGWSKIS